MNYRVSMDLRVLVVVAISAAVLFVAGIMLGGQMSKGQLEVAKKSSQPMIILVDGTKPCTVC